MYSVAAKGVVPQNYVLLFEESCKMWRLV